MLTLAQQLAEDTPKFANARLGAILTVRQHVVALGTNYNPKSHPIAKIFGKNNDAIYPHAELSCILNAVRRDFDDWHKATLWVARVVMINGVFQTALARPCDGCWRAIEHYGIGKVVWTISPDKTGHFNMEVR